MELLKKIEQDFQKATKNAKDIEKRVLRNLKSQIQNKKIELRSKGEELKEADLFKLLKKQAKKHKESIEIFKKGNRDDLVEKEEKELNFLSKYLPEELSDEKIKDIVMSTIKEIGEKTPRVFGQVMGKVMKEVKGKADGTRVKKIVDKILKE